MPGLDEIYEQYRGELFRYLLRLTGSAAQAEDLVSETFLKALQNLHTLKREESLKAWLFSVARHAWLDWLRARRETVELSDLLGLYLADEAPTRAESRALLARVEQLLQQKTPRSVLDRGAAHQGLYTFLPQKGQALLRALASEAPQ